MGETPFDEIVKITWDISGPTAGLIELINSTRTLDTQLKHTFVDNASSYAIKFSERLGLVHTSFQMLLADIREMDATMRSAEQSALQKASLSQVSARTPFGFWSPGQRGPYTETRAPDLSLGSPYDPNLQWAQARAQMGMAGAIPQTYLGLGGVVGGPPMGFFPNSSEGRGGASGPVNPGAAGAAAANAAEARQSNDQVEALAKARLAIAKQEYSQYYRIALLEQQRIDAREAMFAGPSDAVQREQGMGRLLFAQRGGYPTSISGSEYDQQQRANARANYDISNADADFAQRQFMARIAMQTGPIEADTQAFWTQAAAANAAQMAGPVSTAGLSGVGLQAGLNQNLGVAQAQLQNAVQASLMSGGGAPQQAAIQAAAQNVQGLQAQVAALNQVQAAQTSTTAASTSQFARHALGIAETIVIYQGLRLAVDTARQSIEQSLLIQATTARAGYISGQGAGGTQEDFMAAARYGVTPTQAAPGIIAGAQTGADSATKEQARQLALVFGNDQYVNGIQELQQVQLRADSVGLKHVDTLGYLAQAYKTMPQTMEQYFDALQLGIELQSTFGLSAEKSGLAILGITKATEQSPEQIANIFERVRIRLDPNTQTGTDTRKSLARFGIEGGDTATMLREIASQVAGYARTGDTKSADALLGSLVGGLPGPQTLRELREVMVSFDASVRHATEPLADWGKLVGDVGATGETSFKKLKSSWDLLLGSLSNTKPISDAANFFAEGFNRITNSLNATDALKSMTEGERVNMMSQFVKETGGGSLGNLFDVKNGQLVPNQNALQLAKPGWFDNSNVVFDRLGVASAEKTGSRGDTNRFAPDWQSFLDWVAAGKPAGAGEKKQKDDLYAPVQPGRGMLGLGVVPPEFGGFQDLPKGTDWNKFTADIAKYTTQLQKEVPGYQIHPMQVAFWDAEKGHWRQVNGDAEAIRRAMADQTDVLKQISGVFNVPAGGEVMVPFFALQAGFVPSTGYKGPNANSLGTGGSGPGYGPDGSGGSAYDRLSGLLADSHPRSGREHAPVIGGGRSASGVAASRMPAILDSAPGGGRGYVIPITLHTRNQISINGKLIYDEMLHQMQRELSAQRRGFGGGSGPTYLVT